MPTQTCLICNEDWEVHPRRVKSQLYCQTCRRKETKIDYGHSKPCIPWRGEFDNDDNPLKGGKLFMPGARICNHRDCVEPSHLEAAAPTAEDLTAERVSVYYRTKQKMTYGELLRALENEKPRVPSARLIWELG
jgi:hypothetical protein